MSGTLAEATAVRAAFDRLAPDYDRVTAGHAFGHQRLQSHRALARWLPARCRVLEIGCGTGADTLFLARRGLHVTACDPSEAMVSRTLARLDSARLQDRAEVIACGLDDLPELLATSGARAAFDAVVSNFGALNCAPSLQSLGRVAGRHLRPGGRVVVGLLGRACAWEWLYFTLTDRPAQARRRRSPGPVAVPVAGVDVPTYYYRSADLGAALGPDFALERRAALSVLVPPPYLEPRWSRMPAAVRRIVCAADRIASIAPGLNRLGDHTLTCWTKRRSGHG